MMKNTKRLLSLALILGSGLVLASCDKNAVTFNTQVPYGDLTTTNYATAGTLTVNETELYKTMRSSAYSILQKEALKHVLSSYIIKAGSAEYRDDIIDLINTSCFSTTDKETIENMDNETKNKYITKYIDAMYLSGITVTADDLYNAASVEYYSLELAKKLYAIDRLSTNAKLEKITVDGEEKDNTYYASEDKIKAYYESNYKSKGATKAIIVGFSTLAEAEKAMTVALGGATLTDANAQSVFTTLWQNKYSYKTVDADTFVLTDDDLADYPSNLTSMLSSMKVDAAENSRYTAIPQQFSSRVYYVYLIEEKADIEMTNGKVTVDGEVIDVEKELIESWATSTYISNVVTELMNKLDVEIYDPLYAAYWKNSYSEYELANKFDNNLVIKIAASEGITFDGTTYTLPVSAYSLTVRQLYNVLEPALGVSAALDSLSTQYVLSTKYATDLTATDITSYNTKYTSVLKSFTDGELASSGFTTSTMDETTFLTAYYGVYSKDEAINKYKYDAAKKNMFADHSVEVERKTVGEGESAKEVDSIKTNSLYNTLLDLVNQNYYNNFYSLNIQHVLFYVDEYDTGATTNPEVFMKKLSDADKQEFKKEITDLAKAVVAEINTLTNEDNEYNKTLQEAMKYVVKQYVSNGVVYSQTTSTDTVTWGDIKASMKFEIYLKTEDLSAVTNENASNYVTPFKNGVKAYYNSLVDAKKTLTEDNLQSVSSFDDIIQTSYGFHILGSYGSTTVTNAYYSTSDPSSYSNDKAEKKYINLTYCDNDIQLLASSIKNVTDVEGQTGKWATDLQLLIYVAQNSTDEGIVSLPTSVQNYIGKFYSTYNSQYSNSSFQNILLYKILGANAGTVTFSLTGRNDVCEKQVSIAMSQLNSYADWSANAGTLYDGWWNAVDTFYTK